MQSMRVVTTPRFCVALWILACSALAAQTRTLPLGYQARPGDWASGAGVTYPFGEAADLEYQEVHTDWRGVNIPPLRSVGFRRGPALPANTTAVNHAVDLSLRMGPGDFNWFSTTFATNYVGAPSVVFASRIVNMPDWTQPSQSPQAFGLVLPLDAPYVVDPQNDFIWHLQVQNSTLFEPRAARYHTDRSGSRTNTPTLLGPGCVAAGRTAPVTLAMSFTNTGSLMAMSLSGLNYPAGVPVVLNLGLANPDLVVPGLCGHVFARPDLTLPVGATNAAGLLAPQTIALPFVRSLRLAPLFLQAVAPDAGQPGLPLVLSEGRVGGVPCGPVFKYVYSTDPTSTVGLGPYNAGSVITAYY